MVGKSHFNRGFNDNNEMVRREKKKKYIFYGLYLPRPRPLFCQKQCHICLFLFSHWYLIFSILDFLGGNVLTSQRIVDVVLLAFEACAASQGCCNNITFGDESFGYYETVAGGSGAGPTWNGRSGVHVHMTNTR